MSPKALTMSCLAIPRFVIADVKLLGGVVMTVLGSPRVHPLLYLQH
jgi:hypothetical protein